MKQPAVPKLNPTIIRKINKGTRPVSLLFHEINNDFAKSCQNFHDTRYHYKSNSNLDLFKQRNVNSYSCGHLQQTNSFNNRQNVICEPLYEEDEV